MKKTMSRLLAATLTAIMLMSCMVVSALAADARVTSMSYQPHPLYPGMNGNAVVEVDYGDSTGRGICVEPAKDGPAVGSTLSLSDVDATMTRYAYMASQTDDVYRTWCIHHAAANHLGLGNGSRDSGITAVENEVGSVSVPDSFQAFIGRPSNSSYQVMLLWRTRPTGKVVLTKSSANPALTDGNRCYSLAGAVYGVYGSESDARSDSNRVGTLTTDANGSAGPLETKAGAYWYRELVAPKGYALDTGVYSFTVSSGQTTTLRVTDKPQSDPIGVLLKKVDATSGDGEMR